jgi:hypothetical protein
VDSEIEIKQKEAQLILFETVMLKNVATSYIETQFHVVRR